MILAHEVMHKYQRCIEHCIAGFGYLGDSRDGGGLRLAGRGRPILCVWIMLRLSDDSDLWALLDRCDGLSSSVLYERLRELSAAGLIEKDAAGAYRLTDLGAELGDALTPLDTWSRRWADAPGRT